MSESNPSQQKQDAILALEATRSTELLRPVETGLLVIDLQAKLLPIIPDAARILWNAERLLDAAQALGMSAAGTEQYPERLGNMVPSLGGKLKQLAAKRAFSAIEAESIFTRWRDEGKSRLLICGIETHVCVAQSALDLLSLGWQVVVAVDAVGSRFRNDHEIALRRLELAGVTLTTTEAAFFELCATSDRPEFKTISQLAKSTPPDNSGQ